MPPPLKIVLGASMVAATAFAWSALVTLFGAGGALIAILPALLIGAGGILAIAQLAEMAFVALRGATASSASQRPAA